MQSNGAARPWIVPRPAVEALAFRHGPLFAEAVAFACGDAMGRRWHAPAILLAETLGLLALALWALRSSLRVAWLPVLGLWMAVGCWCAQVQPPPAVQTEMAPYADGLSRMVRGRVMRVRTLRAFEEHESEAADDGPTTRNEQVQEDESWEADDRAAAESLDLDVMAAEEVTPDASTMRAVHGGVRVTIFGAGVAAHCGDVVEAVLRLRRPDVYRDPGAFSYADLLLSEGIGYLGSARADEARVTGSESAALPCRLYAAQAWASERTTAFVASRANRMLPRSVRLTQADAALLNAMLFGDRSELTREVRERFERTGTFHLFVVSGVHVALLATGVYWLLRRLRVRLAFALPVTLMATLGYTLLTGFGVPAQRALWMTACVLLARALRRRASALNALGFAAIVVLALSPSALYESGFQMTFLVLFAVAGLAAPMNAWLFARLSRSLRQLENTQLDAYLPPRQAELRVRLRMACALSADLLHPRLRHLPVWLLGGTVRVLELLLFGLMTEAVMVLPMAIYVHRATLLALPANIVVVPLAGVLLTAAVLFFVCAAVSPWLAMLPAVVVGTLLHPAERVLGWANRSSLADVRIPAPDPAAIVVAGVLLVAAAWALRERRLLVRAGGSVAVLLVPLLALWPAAPRLHPGTLEVTAIDVGQGDSLLVVSPDGHTLLMDAGGPSGFAAVVQGRGRPNGRWEVGEDVVAPYLWSRRIRRLDTVAISHAHSDHIGGMSAILRDFHPGELWLSVEPGQSAALAALLQQARAQGITVRHMVAPQHFAWSGLAMEVLAPEASYANPGGPVNDDSLVLRASVGNASALLEGDAEHPSEEAMLEHGRVAPSTLLKVAHHGSRTSTGEAFLQAVRPRDAVISVGRSNTFGHPREEVLQRLEQDHVRTRRTDRGGVATFLLRADGSIEVESGASTP